MKMIVRQSHRAVGLREECKVIFDLRSLTFQSICSESSRERISSHASEYCGPRNTTGGSGIIFDFYLLVQISIDRSLIFNLQGFLPEKELVFFFTLPELHHFIKSRAPRFISRWVNEVWGGMSFTQDTKEKIFINYNVVPAVSKKSQY